MPLSQTTRADSADLDAIRSRVLRKLLAGQFGLDPTTLADMADSARWHQIAAGNIVGSVDNALAVISGVAHRVDENGTRLSGSFGPGQIIGAARALSGSETDGDVVAARDMIVASLDGDSLRRLISTHPEVAPHLFQTPTETPNRPSFNRVRVVALVTEPGLDRRVLSSRLQSALGDDRSVEVLWPERADLMVGHDGASRHERGEVGDLKIRRLVDGVQDQSDHVILETGSRPTPWARRALSMADQIVLVVRANPDHSSVQALIELLDHAPLHTRRLLVVEHPVTVTRAPKGTARLIDELGLDHAVHMRRGTDLAKVARLVTGTGRGLVLSGGGARGFAHLGVYRALHELGIEVDVFGGASIGSPLAAGMADGMPPDELDETVSRLFANVLDYTLPLVALVKGNGIARATADVFGERDIEDLWYRYFCVSTNLTTSTTHRHERGSIVHAIRASTAIPGVMPPVPHGEELLVDAGVTNNLPVDVMRELTPQGDVIAVDTTPNGGPVAKEDFGLSVSGTQAVRHRLRGRRTHPRITSTLLRALIVGSNQHRDRNGIRSYADLYLDLDLRGVPMLDFDAVEELARKGYDISMPLLEGWLANREDSACGT